MAVRRSVREFFNRSGRSHAGSRSHREAAAEAQKVAVNNVPHATPHLHLYRPSWDLTRISDSTNISSHSENDSASLV